jgi:hypothetical protein
MAQNGAAANYRLYAASCVEISRLVSDSANKAALLVMAQSWLELADQTEKHQGAPMLVYEAPEPLHQHPAQQQQQPQPRPLPRKE